MPAVERTFVAQPLSSAGQRVIVSQFQLATGDDDNLQIVSANSLAGVVLTIQGRRVTTAGSIESFSYSHTPNSDRSSKTQNFKLGGGALLNVVVFASSGSPVIGQTYISARIIRGLSAATIMLGALLGGYVTAAQPLAFPGSPIVNSLEGGGYVRDIAGTQPAAGVAINEFVPTGARWELVSLRAILTTNATVANRRPRLRIATQSNIVAGASATATIAASSSATFYWSQGMTESAAIGTDHFFQGLPSGIQMLAGGLIEVGGDNIQAGDQYSPPSYKVREWLQVQS